MLLSWEDNSRHVQLWICIRTSNFSIFFTRTVTFPQWHKATDKLHTGIWRESRGKSSPRPSANWKFYTLPVARKMGNKTLHFVITYQLTYLAEGNPFFISQIRLSSGELKIHLQRFVNMVDLKIWNFLPSRCKIAQNYAFSGNDPKAPLPSISHWS